MSYNGNVIDPGGMATFNMLHGFSEALVRGYKSGFLKDSDYHHLTQCDSLEVMIELFIFMHIHDILFSILNTLNNANLLATLTLGHQTEFAGD